MLKRFIRLLLDYKFWWLVPLLIIAMLFAWISISGNNSPDDAFDYILF